MASSEFENQKEKVESSFRRFGIEGETAFHALAYHYTVYQSGQVKNLPTTILQKWQTAYQKIEKVQHIIDFLTECVKGDESGDKLAEWYQFFIGRRFREASGKFFTPKTIATAMAKFLPQKI